MKQDSKSKELPWPDVTWIGESVIATTLLLLQIFFSASEDLAVECLVPDLPMFIGNIITD